MTRPTCPACHGDGEVYTHNTSEWHRCPACHRGGPNLTAQRQDTALLVRLMKKARVGALLKKALERDGEEESP